MPNELICDYLTNRFKGRQGRVYRVGTQDGVTGAVVAPSETELEEIELEMGGIETPDSENKLEGMGAEIETSNSGFLSLVLPYESRELLGDEWRWRRQR